MYALACVLVPISWGLLIVRMMHVAERFVSKSKKGEDPNAERKELPPLEFHI
jgi:hypothetical protein